MVLRFQFVSPPPKYRDIREAAEVDVSRVIPARKVIAVYPFFFTVWFPGFRPSIVMIHNALGSFTTFKTTQGTLLNICQNKIFLLFLGVPARS